jgi:hypothetical protein
MKRKIILMLLCILGAGQLLRAIQVRIPSLSGVVGDTLTVPVYVDDDLTTSSVTSFQFAISYSPNDIKLLGVSAAGTMSTGFQELSMKRNTDNFTVASAGVTPLAGTGVLFTFRIVLMGYGSSLQFMNGVTSNYFNEGTPVLTFTNGYITISAKPVIYISPGSGIYNIGEKPQFSTWGGTAPYTWSVSDNTIASISADGILSILKNGNVKVISTDSKGYHGESGNMDCRSFKATIRDTSFYQNNYIEIPLMLDNLDGSALFAGKFVLTFDQNILSFDSLIRSNSILGIDAAIQYSRQSGRTIVTFAEPTGVTGSGVLFKLRFKISDISGGASSLTFEEATLNETMPPKCKNGYFSVRPFATLYLTSPVSGDVYTGETKQYAVSGGTSPYTWSVDNTTLATITSLGNLTANAGGSVTVRVKDYYGAQATSSITIYDTWVNVRDSAAYVNNLALLIPVVLGSHSPDKGIVSVSGNVSSQFDKIDSIKVLNTGTLTDNWQLANKTMKNQANFAMSGGVPLVTNGKLLNIKVYFKNTLVVGDAFYLDCSNLLLNEGAPNVKVKSGYVTIKTIFTGLDDTPVVPVSIYPDPVTDRLFINLNDEFGTSVVSILDISGKIVLTRQLDGFGAKQYILPVQFLNEGFYMLKLQSKKDQFVLKFIKR